MDKVKKTRNKTLLKVELNKEVGMLTSINCSIPELYAIVVNLVGELEQATGLDYNTILDDIKDVEKK